MAYLESFQCLCLVDGAAVKICAVNFCTKSFPQDKFLQVKLLAKRINVFRSFKSPVILCVLPCFLRGEKLHAVTSVLPLQSTSSCFASWHVGPDLLVNYWCFRISKLPFMKLPLRPLIIWFRCWSNTFEIGFQNSLVLHCDSSLSLLENVFECIFLYVL